jgi:hypothetical protein
MDAAVRNIGKLLEQGTLEGKHLRPLTYELSGLQPYLADALHMTKQQLEKNLSSGALTRSAIDSRVLLTAIEAYSKDLADKLPESLLTTKSALNDLHNEWFTFKNDIVSDFKPELVGLFDAFRGGIQSLKDNKNEVENVIHSLITLGGAIALFKTASFANAGMVSGAAWLDTLLPVNMPAAIEAAEIEINALNAAATQGFVAFERITASEQSFTFQTNLLNAEISRLESQLTGLIAAEESVNISLINTRESMNQLMVYGLDTAESMGELRIAESELLAELQLLDAEIIKTTESLLLQGETATLAGETLVASARAAGFAWVNAGGAIQKTGQEMATALGVAGTAAGDAFVTGAEEAIVAWEAASATIQSSLNAIYPQYSALAMAPGLAAASNPYSSLASGINGSAVMRGAMGVFIVGMAAEVIGEMTGVFAKNKEINESTNLIDYIAHWSTMTNPYSNGLTKVGGINQANDLHDAIQREIDRLYTQPNNLAFLGVGSEKKLDPTGNALYAIAVTMQDIARKNGSTADLLNVYFKKDKYGNINTSDDKAYDVMQNFGFKLPNFNEGGNFPFPFKSREAAEQAKAGILVHPNDHIKGQRVITYNINIKEMNGAKEVHVDGSLNTVNNVRDFAENLNRVLLDVVKDSQLHEGE